MHYLTPVPSLGRSTCLVRRSTHGCRKRIRLLRFILLCFWVLGVSAAWCQQPAPKKEAVGLVVVAPCTQQMAKVIYWAARDSACRLVVPMNMNGKKVRLAIYRNELTAYMENAWPVCEKKDSLRAAVAGLLAGNRRLPYSEMLFAIMQLGDYKILSWANTYLLESPGNRSYFLQEVLKDYTEEGGFFALNGAYEGDDYVIEALQRYNMLARRRHGHTFVTRVACDSKEKSAGVTGPEPVDTSMGKLVTLMYKQMGKGESYIWMSIPAVLHDERVRVFVSKTTYDKYMIARNSVYRNQDSLMAELEAVLSHKKEWELTDSSKVDADFVSGVQILRAKNGFPGPEEMATEEFIKKYTLFWDDRPNGWAVDCDYMGKPGIIEAFFRHHCVVVYGDGQCAAQWINNMAYKNKR